MLGPVPLTFPCIKMIKLVKKGRNASMLQLLPVSNAPVLQELTSVYVLACVCVLHASVCVRTHVSVSCMCVCACVCMCACTPAGFLGGFLQLLWY